MVEDKRKKETSQEHKKQSNSRVKALKKIILLVAALLVIGSFVLNVVLLFKVISLEKRIKLLYSQESCHTVVEACCSGNIEAGI